MIRWWRRFRMRMYVRAGIYDRRRISAQEIATLCSVDVACVHEYCGSIRTINDRHFQRVHNIPGIDYYAVGLYPGKLVLPLADGAANPFLARLDPAKKMPAYGEKEV